MFFSIRLFQCLLVAFYCLVINATTIFNNAIDSPYQRPLQSPFNAILGLSNTLGFRQSVNPSFSAFRPYSAASSTVGSDLLKRRCPVCDSSVYGYCSEKLFHDSCCCHDPNNPYDQLPYQCQFADCSFLHANTCREHKLITACCCTNYLLYKK
ncbi:uncharacterized protein LOC109536837 [Dendroctonus ponderosae]|uniref:CCC domain-containing protein n=1 Tax=Dendroctonus ponderosae TaxID=77166 RepID=U4U5B9_DENPD|nr:uncharacterized protein LOC109536837 [Dendroctonus ponderosae]ERL85160.1 hypothetical protein D910_02582 [Dendroctonus ponderosae]KAH1015360.1 hypothetical protein HUJ05_013094 [Dendroctonus ponderosae]